MNSIVENSLKHLTGHKRRNVFERTGKEPLDLLRDSVREVHQRMKGSTYAEKMAVIDVGFVNDVETNEVKVASILEAAKNESLITDWFPVPKNGVLDELVVDFVLLRNMSSAVGLQVTSDHEHAKRRRRRIRRIFGDGGIAVLTVLDRKREQKPDERLKSDLHSMLRSDDLLTIQLVL